MSWWEVAAIGLFVAGFLAMGALLAYRLYRNPFLLAGLVPVIWAHVKPVFIKHVWPVLLKVFGRMTPEEEAEMRREYRAGRGDDWLRKWRRKT